MIIDLKANRIPESQIVWRLFPGTSYQFMLEFLEKNSGFLDFPLLDFDKKKPSECTDLIQRIAYSREMKKRFYKPEMNDDSTISLQDFKGAQETHNRARLKSAIINFYEKARIGDLIVMPEPMGLSSLHIGQITSNTIGYEGRFKKYSDSKIPSRSIRWISRRQENSVSAELSKSLRHPHPFTVLERSLYTEVLSIIHRSFSYSHSHVATIENGADFLDSDSALLGIISRLSASATEAVLEKIPELGGRGIINILISEPPIDYTCNQSSDIHSPGFTRLNGKSIAALVVVATLATLIHLGNYSSPASLPADIANVTVINTGIDADPECTAAVSDAVHRILHVELDKVWELCKSAKLSAERAKIKSSATAQ